MSDGLQSREQASKCHVCAAEATRPRSKKPVTKLLQERLSPTRAREQLGGAACFQASSD
jgi:hypothetical protein